MPVAQRPLHERAIRYVKGVGPHRMARLVQLGIETVEDACYYAPRRYEDRRRFVTIAEMQPGEEGTVRATVTATSLRRIRRGRSLFEATLEDASGTLRGVWFHAPYLAQQLKVGEEVILYGRLEAGARRQVIHPELERVELDDDGADSSGAPGLVGERGESVGSLHMGRIVPIYSVTGTISQRWLRRLMATVIERDSAELAETLPESIRRPRGWPGLVEAVRALHFPASWDELEAARSRLAFDELFLVQLALAQRRMATTAKRKPQRYETDGPITEGVRRALPFALTDSQEQALGELLGDLRQPWPMYRLLQGDVGCGKTIVLILLIAAAVQSGYQVALMAPTDLLAEQHARVVASYLTPHGVSVTRLSQGVGAAERAARRAKIARGQSAVVIGTHALIQRGVRFHRLALVIIDEQHKFGVAQRSRLARKAQLPDVLVLTATPIPRTLALSMYGDLAISTITELPPGRRPVTTRWMREAEREALHAMVREHLAAGRQGYVVYPLVEESATREVKAATQMAKHLQTVYPEFRVGLLHGQMKPSTKDTAMQAFVAGELRLLVSTVIVEVGLDVPNATIMVIEHPERFGLAQLHQLRGRIGRGTEPATCVVVSDSEDEAVRKRLEAFVRTTDGFRLAETDLELRGPGALLGRQQHGWLRFRITDLLRDRSLLEEARREADGLMARDPALEEPALAALRERLERFRQQPA